MVEVDIRLVLKQYKPSYIFFKLKPGFYTFKDLSEALFNNLQHDYEPVNNSVDIEIDDITIKTKLVVRLGIIAIGFDEKSFLNYYPSFHSTLGLETLKRIH